MYSIYAEEKEVNNTRNEKMLSARIHEYQKPVVVGLFGRQIKIPLLPTIVNEYQVIASLWGNYNLLKEVIELASQRKIKHTDQSFPSREINRAVDLLRQGQLTGRAVIVP